MGEALLKRHKVPYYTFSTTSSADQKLAQDVTTAWPTSTGGTKSLNISNYVSGGGIGNVFCKNALTNISVSTSYKTYGDQSTVKSSSDALFTMSYSSSTVSVKSYVYSITSEHYYNRLGSQMYSTSGFNCLLIPDVSRLILVGTFDSASAKSVSSVAGLFSSADDFVFTFSGATKSSIGADTGHPGVGAGVSYGSGSAVNFVKTLSGNNLTCYMQYAGSSDHASSYPPSSGFIPLTVYLVPSNLYYNAGAI